tara:strand:+ start:377 stop:859 length:483 start_codon:yes stop_codon:yes gene_type:complete
MPQAALIDLHREIVQNNWVDYNGHMNVAYYVLVFDHATDALLDFAGLNHTHREKTQNSVFVVESHLTYEKEVMEGDELRVTTQILDIDAKRLHIFHRMHLIDSNDLVATNELMILSVNLTTRKVSPFADKEATNLNKIMVSQKLIPSPLQAGQRIGIRKS